MMLALLPLGAVKLPAWFSDNMVLQTDTANGARFRSNPIPRSPRATRDGGF